VQFASSLFNGTFGKRVRIAASENSDKSGKVQPAPKRRGRKATGAVTKEQLLAASQQEESDGGEGDHEPGSSSARQRGAMRSGGADGSKRDVGGSKCKVRITPPEDGDKSDESDGSPVARKATGCVTKQQLLAVAMQDDSDDAESSDDKEDLPSTSAGQRSAGKVGKRVRIAASENSGKSGKVHPAPKRRGRKATGAVTKEQLLAASKQEESEGIGFVSRQDMEVGQPKVRFDTKEEVSEFPVLLTTLRRRGRKATGVATKEQLLEVMSAAGQGNSVASADSEGDEAAEEEKEAPQAARKRCAGRKGTAFAPAAQSEPLLVEEGVDKIAMLPAGWLCCRRP
jgi:hypothetical protein